MNWEMAIANFAEKGTLPTFDDPGQRILIIVPHPDDETLGMAGIIQRAVELKRPIKVVIVTSGESYKKAAMSFCGKTNPTPQDFYRFGVKSKDCHSVLLSFISTGGNMGLFFSAIHGTGHCG